jgi:hypothetical protein
MRRRTSSLDPEARPSANVSVSRSKFLKLTSASLRLPSAADVAVSVVAVAAGMDPPEVAEAMVDSVVDAATDPVDAVDPKALTEVYPVERQEVMLVLLLTRAIPLPSPAWDPRIVRNQNSIFDDTRTIRKIEFVREGYFKNAA